MKESIICQRVSVVQAAKELGCDPLTVRFRMRNGEWDLGKAIPPGAGKMHWQYHIYRAKLDKHLGKAA
ncbi:MAG: hypothetical protein ACRDBO_19665 [Lachnospiraceae bacterium]